MGKRHYTCKREVRICQQKVFSVSLGSGSQLARGLPSLTQAGRSPACEDSPVPEQPCCRPQRGRLWVTTKPKEAWVNLVPTRKELQGERVWNTQHFLHEADASPGPVEGGRSALRDSRR